MDDIEGDWEAKYDMGNCEINSALYYILYIIINVTLLLIRR